LLLLSSVYRIVRNKAAEKAKQAGHHYQQTVLSPVSNATSVITHTPSHGGHGHHQNEGSGPQGNLQDSHLHQQQHQSGGPPQPHHPSALLPRNAATAYSINGILGIPSVASSQHHPNSDQSSSVKRKRDVENGE
jgi:hypothetical protein